ncbi:tetratricopeptide repeat-containing sensor histidine kinase [Flavobacterium psychrotolerans]|uniref:histidine kinase n=1 Tax=Flavobacterium psychrotolerans TaxID=2169410 RepID=A0A2U1JRD7_9FLAO|nr:sensor histidine kinase [Flavobacterium psychrotolerans]PWA07443.1 hypothetical protein DB895_01625 [Flavobacterium psychrotolerans]
MIKKYVLILILLYGLFCFSQTGFEAENLMKAGVVTYSKGNYQEAVALFQKCAVLSKKSGDDKLLGKAYNNLGNVFSRIGKSEQSLKNYFLSLSISKQCSDKLNIAKTYKNIGALYEEQRDFGNAMQYYVRSFELAKQMKDLLLMADCQNNMGIVYEQQLNYPMALTMYKNAFKIYKSKNDKGKISMVLNNLAIVYKFLKNYPQSIKNYEAALVLSKNLDDKFMIAANQNNLGNVYALTGNYLKSLELCQLAYKNAKLINAQEIIIESNSGISTAYEKLNQFAKAIEYRKLYEQEKDAFINTNRSGQLAEIQIKYETKLKEEEIKLLYQERKIKDLKISEQNLQISRKNNQITAFLLLLLGLTIIAYFWKKNQNLKNQLIKEKIIWETEEYERLRIAKDIHDDLGAGLSKINFLSEIIYQKTECFPDIRCNSEAVKETAQKMIENMRDLIWALNPDNTTLGNSLARIREYSTDYLEDFSIDIKYTIPDNIPQTAIRKESHRELFMVIKEALNNISKHSKATQVFFDVSLTEEYLCITIRDNGVGHEGNGKGNGLRNMQSRIVKIGGMFNITSKKDEGTEVRILVSLQKILEI